MSLIRSLLGVQSRATSVSIGHPRDSKTAIALMGGVGSSRSGAVVNYETALAIAAVWACVRAISDDVSKLPISVLDRKADGTTQQRSWDDPISLVFNRRPNEEMTAKVFRETMMSHALLTGNAYAEIVTDSGGRLTSLELMDPQTTRAVRNFSTGRVEYHARNAKGAAITLLPSQVFHLRGPSRDGVSGMSVITMARETLGTAIAGQNFGAALFGNGVRPSGILSVPTVLGDQAYRRLSESFKEKYAGTDNAGEVPILEQGVTFTPISISAKDAEFIMARKFDAIEICRLFRVPPHKIFDLERGTFSNIEHQSIEYVTDCLGGWLVRWEQEADMKLFVGRDVGAFMRHRTAALLRGDIKSRYEAHAIGRNWGWLSVNDVRRLEDTNPIDGGDVYLVPANMTTPEKLQAAPPPGSGSAPVNREAFEEAATGSASDLLASILQRPVRLVADKLSRAGANAGQDFAAFVKSEETLEKFREALWPAFDTIAECARAAGFGRDIGRQWMQRSMTRLRENLAGMTALLAKSEEYQRMKPEQLKLWTEAQALAMAGLLCDVLREVFKENRNA